MNRLAMQSTLFIDQKYIGLISPYLERFHKQDDTVYNFRCPLCGDSKKSKYKARGYFFRHDSIMMMKCHNCHTSISFSKFLEKFDGTLFREYKTECYIEGGGRVSQASDFYTDDDQKPAPEKPKTNQLNIPCVSDLPADHYARKYVTGRMIPKDQWRRLYYSSVFSQTLGEVFPDYYTVDRHKTLLRSKEARLVMPYYDREKRLIGLNGRAFEEKFKRYIIAKASESSPKIYGLDEIEPGLPVFVLEGPIDSLFLPNALAVMDGKLHGIDHLLGGLGGINKILVPDNQPRNPDVCRSIRAAIEADETIVLWPSDIEQKDINAMVTDGNLSVYEILKIIERRTFRGLSAKLEFSRWQKIN